MDVRVKTTEKAEHLRIDTFELWCWRKRLRVPWTANRSSQSILKGNQSWIFTGRTDAEAETPMLWPSDVKNRLIGKDPDARKDWRWDKGMTEDEMVGWHHWLNGHEFGWAPRVGVGQGGLACCSSWRRKELDMTEWLNWTELRSILFIRRSEWCFSFKIYSISLSYILINIISINLFIWETKSKILFLSDSVIWLIFN